MQSVPPSGPPHRADVRVAVLDGLEDVFLKDLRAALPPGWSCVRPVGDTEDSHREAVHDSDAVFVLWRPVTRAMIDGAPRLRLIQKLGAGVDRIDLEACRERGIAVAKLAGSNAAPVAEHAIMLMLAALRQLPSSDRRMKAGEWFKEEARRFQRELRGKRVGLIGLGHIGRRVAARLGGFEAEVVYFDIRRPDPEIEERLGVTLVDLDELVRTADIVSLHVPLTEDTRQLLDEARIRAMKPGAIVVNCARGGLIDERALAEALREGRLAGAALDTFANEPLPDASLVRLPNVICTPHSAGATSDNFPQVARRAVQNARAYLAGDPLPEGDVVYAPPAAGAERSRISRSASSRP
jgi:D-3-phosphoglycerate dehydrogenase / 2-oxoglutarate reductase